MVSYHPKKCIRHLILCKFKELQWRPVRGRKHLLNAAFCCGFTCENTSCIDRLAGIPANTVQRSQHGSQYRSRRFFLYVSDEPSTLRLASFNCTIYKLGCTHDLLRDRQYQRFLFCCVVPARRMCIRNNTSYSLLLQYTSIRIPTNRSITI